MHLNTEGFKTHWEKFVLPNLEGEDGCVVDEIETRGYTGLFTVARIIWDTQQLEIEKNKNAGLNANAIFKRVLSNTDEYAEGNFMEDVELWVKGFGKKYDGV